jgi:hypothetical protein
MTNLSSLSVQLEFYDSNGRVALVAYQGMERYGKITTNLLQFDIEPNEFFVKTYSENTGWALPLLQQHLDLFHCQFGKGVMYNGLYFPVYNLTNKFIAEEFEKTYNAKSDVYDAPQPLWNLYEKYCVV